VFRLEKKLRVMEKAENAAVHKIRAMELANRELEARLQDQEQETNDRVSAMQAQWTKEKEGLEQELQQLKQLGSIEDLQVSF
jgi:hypothetical protein